MQTAVPELIVDLINQTLATQQTAVQSSYNEEADIGVVADDTGEDSTNPTELAPGPDLDRDLIEVNEPPPFAVILDLRMCSVTSVCTASMNQHFKSEDHPPSKYPITSPF